MTVVSARKQSVYISQEARSWETPIKEDQFVIFVKNMKSFPEITQT